MIGDEFIAHWRDVEGGDVNQYEASNCSRSASPIIANSA